MGKSKLNDAVRTLRHAYKQAIEQGKADVTISTDLVFQILRYRCNGKTVPKPYASELDWTPLEQSESTLV